MDTVYQVKRIIGSTPDAVNDTLNSFLMLHPEIELYPARGESLIDFGIDFGSDWTPGESGTPGSTIYYARLLYTQPLDKTIKD